MSQEVKPTHPMSLPPPSGLTGSTVAGRYDLVGPLGAGGMGQVYVAQHRELGRQFALKVLRLERWSEEMIQRFRREAQALARIHSPRVAQVTDFGVDDAFGPFYVMELVEGETLDQRMEGGPLEPKEAIRIVLHTLEALADVHAAGVVHRDVKPSNIGLPRAGPVQVKLIDFGLAAATDDLFLQRITRSEQVLGSVPYMAPEQFAGARPAASLDLYACGVVLFEAIAGRLPFTAPSTAALIHQILVAPAPRVADLAHTGRVTADLEELVTRLLAKEPGDRPSSATEAAQQLGALIGEEPAAPMRPSAMVETELSVDPNASGTHPSTRGSTPQSAPRTSSGTLQSGVMVRGRTVLLSMAVIVALMVLAGVIGAMALKWAVGAGDEPAQPSPPASAAATGDPMADETPLVDAGATATTAAAPGISLAPDERPQAPALDAGTMARTPRKRPHRTRRPHVPRGMTNATKQPATERPAGGMWTGGIIDEPF